MDEFSVSVVFSVWFVLMGLSANWHHTTPRTDPMLEAQLSEQVLGAFFKVYRNLGYGFLESVYANSLAIELRRRGVEVLREVLVDVSYEGARVGSYKLDLLAGNRIMIEIKSTKMLSAADERQLLNYLKATSIEIGFLLHFGPEPHFRRRILTNDRKHL
jgi:GxxExxY protein